MSASTRLPRVAPAACLVMSALLACDRASEPQATPTPSTGTVIDHTPAAAANPSEPPLTGFDKTFATSAAQGGLFEIEAGKLGRDKASDPAVKDFARRLVEDHRAAKDKLLRIAARHNLTLPGTLPAATQKELDTLARLSGAGFDRQFMQEVGLKDHESDIALFEQAAKEAASDNLREFAKSTLPALRDHLSTATRLPASSGKS